MAFGGSPLSCGSDIGGSLRGPAACVGLWALKSTVGRFPKSKLIRNQGSSLETTDACFLLVSDNSYRFNAGYEGVTPVVGPQCRSLRDVNLIYKTVIDTKPWLREHAVFPMPWQADPQPVWSGKEGRIRVGYMESDGVVRPQPPIIRGIQQVVEALRKNDRFEVVPFGAWPTFPLGVLHSDRELVLTVPLDHKRGGDLTVSTTRVLSALNH